MYAVHTGSLMTKSTNHFGLNRGLISLSTGAFPTSHDAFELLKGSVSVSEHPDWTSQRALYNCLLHPKWRFWKCIPLSLVWFPTDFDLIKEDELLAFLCLFVSFLTQLESWRADQCMVPPLSGRVLALRAFQLMPFLILKNKGNVPDLVQLCVPLSAASLLWFLLVPLFHLQPCCSDPPTLSFPSGLHLAVHPALLGCSDQFRPVLLPLLCSLNCSSRLGASKPLLLCCCSPQVCASRGCLWKQPHSGIFSCAAALQGEPHSPLDELKPLSLHWNTFFLFNDIPITC